MVISKAKLLYAKYKCYLEKIGFNDVVFTGLERDALNIEIKEMNPKIILIESDFYQAATPFNVGEILKVFPDLNIAACAVNNFPLSIAVWFIWYGAKSCLHLWADGWDEFKHGLDVVMKGKQYISPKIKSILNLFREWPETKNHVTKRQLECLILMCCGLKASDIANEMNVSRKTIDNTFSGLFDVFQVHSREELFNRAWTSGIVNKEDLRFYRYDKKIILPEWARVKEKSNLKLKKSFFKV